MKNKAIIYISFLVSLLLLLLVFSNFNNGTYGFFFSSDALYLPSIYKDVFIDGYGINGWELNPAPNVFPDMLVYFLLMFVFGGNFILASFVFSIVQYFAILYLLHKILSLFIEQKKSLFYVSLGNLFLSLMFLHFLVTKDIWFTFQIISNSFHLGAFIMTLWVGYLSVKYIKTKSNKRLFLIGLLVFLAAFSDKLFIAQFVGTLIFISILFLITNKQYLKPFLWLNVVSIVMSYLAIFIIKKIPYEIIHFGSPYSEKFDINAVKESFIYQIKHLYEIITESWLGVFYIIILLGYNISSIYIILKKKNSINKPVYWGVLILFSYNFISFFLPSLTGSYMGFDCIRYNINVYITSFVLIPFLLSIIWNKKVAFYASILPFVISIFFVFSNLNTLKNPSQLISFYPERTQIIDELKTEYNLKNGIGNYWYAKFCTMHSKNNLRIYSVHSNLAKYEHVTNYRWFFETPNQETPVYNFIVLNGDDEVEAIKKLFPTYKFISKGFVNICITPNFTFEKNNPFPVLLN